MKGFLPTLLPALVNDLRMMTRLLHYLVNGAIPKGPRPVRYL
jgi:hypothetical protein